MNILIITLLLVVVIKKTLSGGLFIDSYKGLDELKERINTQTDTSEDLMMVVKMLLITFSLLAMQIYSFYLGVTIAPLVIPTILMCAHMIYCSMRKSEMENLGKYTIGSVAEDLASVVYYAYFLYILI